jgi:lysyl-tRNA synthetase class 2
MFQEQKSNLNNNNITWQPSASINILKQRANILASIRQFFAVRDVLEVETPVFCHTSVTDPFIQSIPAIFESQTKGDKQTCYLQTSPEYAMKRLLCAGSGSIYQITKSFRQGEVGRFHNPEFSMLEWYRINFDHHDLMNEMDALLQLVLQMPSAERKTYAQMFQDALALDPHTATLAELAACARKNKLDVHDDIHDRDTWLQLLMSHCIEPTLGKTRPFFVYDFPASQAALARIQSGNPAVASRFEVYVNGIELANGFHELQSADEQRTRFINNQHARKELGLNPMALDEYFLAALSYGLPNCAGVALGVDRLIMLATQSERIADVLSFDFTRV